MGRKNFGFNWTFHILQTIDLQFVKKQSHKGDDNGTIGTFEAITDNILLILFII